MRTIDANMQTALASKTRRPAVGLTIEDHTVHLSAYQAPGLSDQWSDCCIASDGSIIRVNVTRAGFGFTSNFQYARITDPSVAGQWSSVTTFAGGSGNIYEDGGCCVSNNSGTLRAFAQQGTGGNALWCWTSTNNGVSWTGPTTVESPPGGAATKGIASAGNNDVFFLYDVSGGETGAIGTISGGLWTIHVWTLPTIPSGAGIAVYWTGSQYNLAYSDGYTIYSATYNGSTWTQGPTIAATTSQSVGRISPRLQFFDSIYYLISSEYDTGSLSGSAYQYCRVRESADFVHWSDGWIIHEVSSLYGGNYFFLPAPQTGSSGARYYFSTPSTVLSTPAFSTSNSAQYLDVSASILSYKRIEKVNKPAELEVIIDNRGGVYNGLTNLSGGTSYQPITPGALLKLSEGYMVGTPPNTPDKISTGTYRLMKAAVMRSPTQHQIQLIGIDLTERMDRISRWQNIYSGQTIQWLLLEVCARAGIFAVSITGSSQLSQVVPTFVIQANQRYRAALDSLCTTYGLDYFLDQTETLQIREISASDASVWSYQNEIEQVSFGADYQRANHVIASGKPPSGGSPFALTTSEAYDDTASAALRVERIFQHTDFKSTTSTQAAIAAGLVLYTEQRAQIDVRLVVPLNPALQLVDVVTVTDAAAPTGSGQSQVGRMIEHQALYDAQKAEYESHLSLQGH